MDINQPLLDEYVGGKVEIITFADPPVWTRAQIKTAVPGTDGSGKPTIDVEYENFKRLTATGEWESDTDGCHGIRLAACLPPFTDEGNRIVLDVTEGSYHSTTIILSPPNSPDLHSYATCLADTEDEGECLSLYNAVLSTRPDENGKFLSKTLRRRITRSY